MTINDFLHKNKWWLLILAVFLSVRIVIFVTFWQASLARGGWENFYAYAQPARSVLMMNFHDYCDWHPPLYYFFTSSILFLFKTQWLIYFFQLILAFVSLILIYKIARLFFSEKIALISAFIVGIEPHWAWHNWLLASDNLSVPLFLAGIYYFFKFLKLNISKNIYYSAIFFGLATLTRPNTLLLGILLSVLVIIIFKCKKWLKLEKILRFNAHQLTVYLIVFNLIFFAILVPWAIRNKFVYGRFTIANILSTNIYFYNLPPLISLEKNISYDAAYRIIENWADKKLGKNVGDQGNCQLFSKEEFSQQLDYYESQSKRYIFANLSTYLKIHLIKAVPFLFQPGYPDMWFAYTGQYDKPDLTGLFLRGNFREIGRFFSQVNVKLIVYLLGVAFWGISSLAVVIGFFYSYFRDKDKFLFFLISLIIIGYNALLISPFVLARYRFPVYLFFLVPLIYGFTKLIEGLKLKKE